MSEDNTKKASEELMDELHGELAKQMQKRLKSGEATAADMNVIRAFLKDNGIEGVPAKGSHLGNLADDMPDLDEDGNVVAFK